MATHVPILCPSCRLYRQIRPEYLGRRVVCRRCGHKFEARERDEPSPSSSAPAPGEQAAAPAPASAAASEGRPLRAELVPRNPEHSRVRKQLRETQDWLSQLHDQVHDLHEQLEQARPAPAPAPAPAAAPELDHLRTERDELRARVAELERRAEEADRLEAPRPTEGPPRPSAEAPGPDPLAPERDRLRDDVHWLQAERDHLAAELKDLRDRPAGAGIPTGTEPAQDHTERDALRARVAELERQAAASDRLAVQLRADLARVNNLWAQLEEGQTAPPPLPTPSSARLEPAGDDQLDRLAAELDAVRAERDRLAAQVQERPQPVDVPLPPSEPDAVSAERDELRVRVAELERRAEEADRLEARMRADQSRANDLWAHLEEGQVPAASLQTAEYITPGHDARATADAEQTDHLTAQLRAVQDERDHLAAEVQDLRHRQDQRIPADAERLDRLVAERDAARAERDRLAAEADTLRDERDQARAEEPDAVRALRQERDALHARVAALELRAGEADRLDAQLRAHQARANDLWAHLEEDQTSGASSGTGALETVTRERDQLRDEVRSVRAELDRAQGKLKAELEKASRLWAELQESQTLGPA